MAENYKILVVEDNDFVRMQIAKFLEDSGHAVVEAREGNEATKLIDETFDLAIVDVRMTPMDGFDFIRAVHGNDINVPIILATGDNDPDMLADASNLSVAAVLMKPVDRERLIATVERTMKKKKRA
ncbi:MAG: response regulator [Pseudomonadota bacterium]